MKKYNVGYFINVGATLCKILYGKVRFVIQSCTLPKYFNYSRLSRGTLTK